MHYFTCKLKNILILALILGSADLLSQNNGKESYDRNNPYHKKIGIGIGGAVDLFMGDAGSSSEGSIQPALTLKLDYFITRSVAFDFNLGAGYMGETYNTPNLMLADFEATFGHAHLNGRLHFDGLLNLKTHPFISPYFTAGVGIMKFESYYNLLDRYGNPYLVNQNGIITDQAGNPVIRDDNFETPIDEEDEYSHLAFIMPVGGGMKLQFSEHIEFTMEAMVFYTTQDKIDGYLGFKQTNSGKWIPSENNSANDYYLFGGFTLMYNLGYNPERRIKRILPSIQQ